jgi:hypothetical protein
VKGHTSHLVLVFGKLLDYTLSYVKSENIFSAELTFSMTTVQNFKNSSVSPPPTKLGVSHLGHPVTLEEVCSTFMVKMYRIAKKLLRHTTSELEVCIEKCHVTDYTLKKENFHSYELQLFQHLKEKDSLNGKQKFVNGFSITLKIMTISEVNERN